MNMTLSSESVESYEIESADDISQRAIEANF